MVSTMEPPPVIALDAENAAASAASQRRPRAWPWSRLDLGHPLFKLAVVGALVAVTFGVAVSFQEPAETTNAIASSAPSASALLAPIQAPTASSIAVAAAPAREPDSAEPIDVDPEDAPVHHHGSSHKKVSVSHAPDAKAGDAVGYRDGEPVHMTLTIVDGKPVEVHTAAAFRRMKAAAARAGLSLVIVSGFRTMERQKELYADYRAGRGHLAALPGHSNHQSGHALDLAVADQKVRAWLEAHAAEFEFRRTIPSESWHWEHG
jgi:hypothetical protein